MIRWTQDQVAQLRRLVEAGLSSTAIAEEMGMTPESVRSKMRQIGLRSRWAGNCGDWDADRIEMLRRLWAAGYSASQIADKLGSITRNAVIGKVYRLGLSGREKPAARAGQKERRTPHRAKPARQKSVIARERKAAAARYVAEPAAPPSGSAFSGPAGAAAAVQALKRGECKFPIGEPTDMSFRFCGEPQVPGQVYCDHHCRIAYPYWASEKQDNHLQNPISEAIAVWNVAAKRVHP